MVGADPETIRVLFDIACDYQAGLKHQIDRLLRHGCRRFGLEVGVLTQAETQHYRVLQHCSPAELQLQDGAMFDLQEACYAIPAAKEEPVAAVDLTKIEPAGQPTTNQSGFKACLGISLRLDGTLFGILGFASLCPGQRCFEPEDLTDLKLMADWLRTELSRQRREDSLQRAEEKYRIGFSASPSPMLIITADGLIEHVNQEAARLFQYSQHQLVGKPIELLIPEEHQAIHPKLREGFANSPLARPMGSGRDLTAQNAKGEVFPVEIGLKPIRTSEGLYVLCAMTDLTERKRYEQTILEQAELLKETNKQLSLQAITDNLTGLFNRHHFMSKLQEYISLGFRSGECVSVLMLDVDHFKKYNDSFGHTAGDEALKVVAEELTRQTRHVDIVARYGGEEFIILLPATDREGAMVIAERIRAAVASISSLQRAVTLSGGVATTVNLGDPNIGIEHKCKEIIERADRALYWSKQKGRNRITHIEYPQRPS